jgi:1,4-alpha-glucan branching enzyme
MSHSAHLRQGATLEADGVRFRLWAPGCDSVALVLEVDGRTVTMQRQPGGFYDVFVDGIGAGTLYRYQLPDGLKVPDPASRYQPQDVHGPSEVIDPNAYDWTESWSGRPWNEIVLYELHVGAFTPEGTFRAAIARLDHLADLGVTAIEIMPISDFPGGRNWL